MSDPTRQLTVVPAAKALKISATVAASIVVPRVIAAAGDQAARRFLEFFAATIRNKNTRMAYYRAAVKFFAWCDQHEIGEEFEEASRGLVAGGGDDARHDLAHRVRSDCLRLDWS